MTFTSLRAASFCCEAIQKSFAFVFKNEDKRNWIASSLHSSQRRLNHRFLKSSTVASYLSTLEKAYIVYQAHRFDIKGKEQLKTLSKFYVADTGIRNALLGYSDGDMGHVLETVVYFELLRRGYRVFIGKWYDSEVDFLAIRQDTRKYYQVTLSLMDESVKARELAPLAAIHDNYEKSVLSMDKTYITNHEGIRFENIIDFLLSE